MRLIFELKSKFLTQVKRRLRYVSVLQAAAATAIMMDEACCEVTEEPKEFIANEPFRFYICGGENDSEVLFSGQIVK